MRKVFKLWTCLTEFISIYFERLMHSFVSILIFDTCLFTKNFLYIFYPRKTVFGISCYRQIDVDKIKNKTDDITRGSVQKSVCVLSRLPLYGQIQVKMCLITQAYFEEGDFSKVELINETYSNLNSCLSDDLLHTQQLYVGQSWERWTRLCYFITRREYWVILLGPI